MFCTFTNLLAYLQTMCNLRCGRCLYHNSTVIAWSRYSRMCINYSYITSFDKSLRINFEAIAKICILQNKNSWVTATLYTYQSCKNMILFCHPIKELAIFSFVLHSHSAIIPPCYLYL